MSKELELILPDYYSEYYFENEILTKIEDDVDRFLFKKIFYKHNKAHNFYSIRKDADINLLNKIPEYFCSKIIPVKISNSSLYIYKIPFIEMGGIRFYRNPMYGKKNLVRKEFIENNKIPDNSVLPAKIQREKMLPISKKIIRKLKINEDINFETNTSKSKWLVGTYLLNNDTIFLFKSSEVSEGNPLIRCLSPILFEEDHDFVLYSTSFRDIYIFRDSINIYRKKGSYYFNVPDLLLNITESDYGYLNMNCKKPGLPAYEINYDVMGNFIYNKVFYAETSKRDSAIMSELYSNENIN